MEGKIFFVFLLIGVTVSNCKSAAQYDLEWHNYYRAIHHAQPLVLSDWLSRGAQAWAEHLSANNQFYHSQGNIDGKGVG